VVSEQSGVALATIRHAPCGLALMLTAKSLSGRRRPRSPLWEAACGPDSYRRNWQTEEVPRVIVLAAC